MRENDMKLAVVLVAGLTLATLRLGAAEQTWVGEISDSACGLQHESGTENVPPPPAKECVANCIRGGSKYVLVVDKKVMQIANQSVAGLADLAGSSVKVTGEAKGDSITIAKIAKAQ
jgi:hypothetical protein